MYKNRKGRTVGVWCEYKCEHCITFLAVYIRRENAETTHAFKQYLPMMFHPETLKMTKTGVYVNSMKITFEIK